MLILPSKKLVMTATFGVAAVLATALVSPAAAAKCGDPIRWTDFEFDVPESLETPKTTAAHDGETYTHVRGVVR